ncbi:YopX family protein [Bacillus sp. SB47]|uniref:YopX family protein n=1 Tax=Bacillus sp. SB47 TaxID=1071079 RepID=UPI00041F59E7|nr:YopX family protein [Bacillus sp. SB47]
MDIIKIRYTFRHKGSGNIEMKWYSIGQLEERAAAKLSPVFSDEYELISRDLYTGLKDKNGREIYEGDVVKFKSVYYENKIMKAVVKFKDYLGSFVFDMGDDQGPWRMDVSIREIEVIGNIYQNPNLLLEAAE